MLAKSIVALFIISIISLTATMATNGLSNMVNDRNRATTLALMDKKLIAWYANHGGELPEAINNSFTVNQLEAMGARFLDIHGITYDRQADNRFQLSAVLTDGTVIRSANSGRNLMPVIHDSL